MRERSRLPSFFQWLGGRGTQFVLLLCPKRFDFIGFPTFRCILVSDQRCPSRKSTRIQMTFASSIGMAETSCSPSWWPYPKNLSCLYSLPVQARRLVPKAVRLKLVIAVGGLPGTFCIALVPLTRGCTRRQRADSWSVNGLKAKAQHRPRGCKLQTSGVQGARMATGLQTDPS